MKCSFVILCSLVVVSSGCSDVIGPPPEPPQQKQASGPKMTDDIGEFDPAAEIEGVLVQKMAPAGREVILGLNRYPVFGPLLMVGIGGMFVEVFQDVVFRLAPIGRNEARRMVRQIKGYRLFQGFRGRPQADVETIEKSLVSLSKMATNHPEIMELDINPLLVHERGQGATAADCRIILKKLEDETEKDE